MRLGWEVRMSRGWFEIKLGAALLAVFAGFWIWQNPGVVAGRLKPAEINANLAAIDKQLVLPPDEKPQLLARARAWMEADDGKPVYMLNLMRFYPQLRRIPGAPAFSGTPQQSNAHYEARTMPLLFERGGYPLIAGPPQGANLMSYEPGLDGWSRMLVVRYPSRRAFMQLVTDPAYGPGEPYKLMALKVVLTPTSGEVVVPELTWLVGGALFALFLAAGWWRAARRD
jgi:hypothetical protein